MKAAKANRLFYLSSINTYAESQPDLVRLETRLREKYQPRQRRLESEMGALDTQRAAQAQLQVERELGPQRTLEALRRQYEMNPQAFALNRAMGDQVSKGFSRLYGVNPASAVPPEVSNNAGVPPIDYLGNLPRTSLI